jgi:hypothetical protein
MRDVATAQRLFDAYRKGLLNKVGADPRDYHPRFQVLLRQLLSNQLSLAERLPVRKVWRASSQGLHLAREGRLEEAAACLDSGVEALEQTRSSVVGHLMATSVLESALAYLDFRQSRLNQARERLLRSLEVDLTLEQDDRFGLLEIHRIQSAQNLMRLEFRAGRPEVACSIGGTILGYLENLTNGVSVHHSWCRGMLMCAPRAVRRAMVAQVANEMAPALTRMEDSTGWERFSEELELHSPYFAREGVLHRQVQQWVLLKHAFERKDWPRYLILLADFLPEGRKDVPAIWYSSVIDFLHFCRETDAQVYHQVRAGILRDSRKWPALPSSLRPCLRGEEESVQ